MSSQLASDKELATSLRWMAKDKKNAFKNLIIRILEKMGINQKEWTASACLLNKGVSEQYYQNFPLPSSLFCLSQVFVNLDIGKYFLHC